MKMTMQKMALQISMSPVTKKMWGYMDSKSIKNRCNHTRTREILRKIDSSNNKRENLAAKVAVVKMVVIMKIMKSNTINMMKDKT
jgi:hypothetical protein